MKALEFSQSVLAFKVHFIVIELNFQKLRGGKLTFSAFYLQKSQQKLAFVILKNKISNSPQKEREGKIRLIIFNYISRKKRNIFIFSFSIRMYTLYLYEANKNETKIILGS